MKTFIIKIPVTTLLVYKIKAKNEDKALDILREKRPKPILDDENYRNEDWDEIEIQECRAMKRGKK